MTPAESMTLKVLLPCSILLEQSNVRRIVLESPVGFHGIWPRRLDCSIVLVPGILSYQCNGEKEKHLAHDRGLAVKIESLVLVSVRYGVEGVDLGFLRKLVGDRCRQMDRKEHQMRSLVSKIESEMIRETAKLQHA